MEVIINKILSLPYFNDKPPVLVDIGASGEIHPEWQWIAKHSICIAFDADSRDFKNTENASGYKRLFLVNAIVSDKEDKSTRFYLTASPHCSSSLEPINEELSNWSFSGLFKVERTIELNNISLGNALKQNNISYVDWYKTDSQGIDLRLFKALDSNVQKNVLVAEFEPGFIDAYKNEDKISGLLPYMETLPFWMSDCIVKGSQRINETTLKRYNLNSEKLNLRNSSCWAEFTYINTCENLQSERDLLLTIVFCCIKKQYGFALDTLTKLGSRLDAGMFSEIEKFLLTELSRVEEPVNEGFLTKIKKAIK